MIDRRKTDSGNDKVVETKFRRFMDDRMESAYSLAKATGIPYSTLTKYVNGSCGNPCPVRLAKITEYLKCSLSELY